MSESEDGLVGQESGKPVRRKRGLILLLSCISVLVLVLTVAGFYVGRGLSAISGIERDPGLTPSEYPDRPPSVAPSAPGADVPVNFVLMGSDSRGSDQGRSDSLMVAHITGDRKQVYLVSFPRDMWVEIPGHGRAKINAAYAYGGPQLTVATLESITGVRMDHTVLIDFEGFIKLTEVIGGVDVFNPWATDHPTGAFPQGDIHLEGERALAYVRQRKNLPGGDLDRAYRQQTVVKAIIRKLFTPETLANPATFSDVVGKLADTMTVDDQMTTGFMTDLALSMRLSGGSDSIRLLQAPIAGYATINGQAVDIVDTEGIADLSRALSTDTMGTYFAEHQGDRARVLSEVEPPE